MSGTLGASAGLGGTCDLPDVGGNGLCDSTSAGTGKLLQVPPPVYLWPYGGASTTPLRFVPPLGGDVLEMLLSTIGS